MKRKLIIFSTVSIAFLFLTSCGMANDKYEDNAVIYNYNYESEHWPVTMSIEETDELRTLLAEDRWIEADSCGCVDQLGTVEVLLDGVYYSVCDWYWMTPTRDIHSIAYKNSADEEYQHAMINENDDVMIQIYNIIKTRSDMGTEYNIFMDRNQKKSSQATLNYLYAPDDQKVIISKKDTKRLRELLTLDQGWHQNYICLCIGQHSLVLDNIEYVIDTSKTEHQIKYSKIGDNVIYGLENKDKEVVQEVYDIVLKYLPEKEILPQEE